MHAPTLVVDAAQQRPSHILSDTGRIYFHFFLHGLLFELLALKGGWFNLIGWLELDHSDA